MSIDLEGEIMICALCGGKLKEGKTEFIFRVKDEIVVIKNVPALICERCEESYVTPDVSKRIDEIMESYHEGKCSVKKISACEISL